MQTEKQVEENTHKTELVNLAKKKKKSFGDVQCNCFSQNLTISCFQENFGCLEVKSSHNSFSFLNS